MSSIADHAGVSQGNLFPVGDILDRDPCRRKHHGNVNSVAAHERIRQHKAGKRERILAIVAGCGARGATLLELCEVLGTFPNRISGRISELKKRGKLVQLQDATGPVQRRGCAVYVVTE